MTESGTIKIRRGPLQIVVLLVVPETAQQQRQADDPVQDDHQEGEHGIPPSVGAASAVSITRR